MPPLKRPPHATQIRLPPRDALDLGEADVLIAGGGPAGLGAALGAAGAGAGVVLAEQYGFLGGNATAALVMPIATYYTELPAKDGRKGQDVCMLLPQDHSAGKPVIGGALGTLVERLVRAGGAIAASPSTGFVVPFDAEVFKTVAFDLLDEAGVQFLLHTFAGGVAGDEGSRGVVFETKSGPVVLRAKVIVDCTGDGDVAALAGCAFESGRKEDGLVQPMSLMFLMAQFEASALQGYCRTHPGQWQGVHGLWELIDRATQAGELDLPREDILLFSTTHRQDVSVNSTRVTNVSGMEIFDLTHAEWQGRRQVRQIAAFLKKYVPGFENAYLAQSGATVGVRETRRITGRYVLTAEDILSARKFDDAIAHGTYPIDIHNPAGRGTTLRRVPAGEAYDIPLRCLIPESTEGLLLAGRCISGTHEALSSYRVMPISVATGQAAGVCAAVAARKAVRVRDIDPDDVRAELRRQGAILLH